jgi:hypothetical protein
MGLSEAFRHYLEDEGFRELTVKVRGEKWRLFKKAMQRRRTKAEAASLTAN